MVYIAEPMNPPQNLHENFEYHESFIIKEFTEPDHKAMLHFFFYFFFLTLFHFFFYFVFKISG